MQSEELLLKVGDLVKIKPHVQPPELYGIGIVTRITQVFQQPYAARAIIHWANKSSPRGDCSVNYLEKINES